MHLNTLAVLSFLVSAAALSCQKAEVFSALYQRDTPKLLECLQSIAEPGAIVDERGCNLMVSTVFAPNLDMARHLQQHGVHANVACEHSKMDAVTAAKLRGQDALLQYFSQSLNLQPSVFRVKLPSGDCSQRDWFAAARAGDQARGEACLLQGINVDTQDEVGCTAAVLAAINQQDTMVKYLHQRGADLSRACSSGLNIVQYAAQNGRLELIKYLHAASVDLEAEVSKDVTALTIATRAGQVDTAVFLHRLDGALDENWSGSPLMWAAAMAADGMVSHLLENGKGSLTDKDHHGHTCMHWAAIRGNHVGFSELVQYGADPQVRSHAGLTPLMCAAFNGHNSIVEHLMKLDVDAEARDKAGWTAMAWAVAGSKVETVGLLIDRGASLNPVANAWSLLHIAAATGKRDVAMELMKRGVSFNAVTDDGSSCEDVARANGHQALADEFKRLVSTYKHHHRQAARGHEEL